MAAPARSGPDEFPRLSSGTGEEGKQCLFGGGSGLGPVGRPGDDEGRFDGRREDEVCQGVDLPPVHDTADPFGIACHEDL